MNLCKTILAASLQVFIIGAFVAGHAAPAEAGIVITREGKVIIGRVVKEEVTKEGVRVHWPYKERRERGTAFFQMNIIRWFDPDLDEPSAQYWEEHANEAIDAQFLPLRDRYLDSKSRKMDPNMKIFLDTYLREGSKVRLSPISIPFKMGNAEITIRKPEGWQRQDADGILMLVSDTKGEEGVVPRIHVFSVPRIENAQFSECRDFLKADLLECSGGAEAVEFKEEDQQPKNVKGGADWNVTTVVRKQGQKPITTLRHMAIRDNRIYFYSAYCHERDFEKLGIFFRACLQSLTINDGAPATSKLDDPKPGDKPADKPGDTPPADKSGDKPGDKAPEKTGSDAPKKEEPPK
jgi:hypothetical protein